jgi:transglutaminase-like putative cysteine protease
MLNSPMVQQHTDLADYATPSFSDDRPFLSAVMDLTQRIFADFSYDPQFSDVATPLADVLKHKRGVCQDFAHLAIGCLRSLGYPARYVSGYLETLPAAGQEKLIGADATHAWFAVYSPGEGWYEFDPTNNKMTTEQHITTAWGRDYSDVSPLKGVIFGGGHSPQLQVSVDVQRVQE